MEMPKDMVVAVLLTCFNRREKSLTCLRRLFRQRLPERHRLRVFLVDDGSRDGTGDAVREEFPEVTVLPGTGSLYWCGGMRLAWAEAAKEDPDYYLALNDDTMITEDALESLLGIIGDPARRMMAVAAICDQVTGMPTYGGRSRDLRQDPVVPNGEATRCATANANCLLIARAVYREIGMFYPYTHGMADYDYGFTATRRGIEIWQSGSFLGTCSRDSRVGTWQDVTLPRRERLRKLMAPTGLPLKDHLTYRMRHDPWTWPRYILSPFVRILLKR